MSFLEEYEVLNRSSNSASLLMEHILTGVYNEHQVAALLARFAERGLSLDELKGFRDTVREQAVRIDLSDFNPLDLCGTGGDGKNTINVSTLAAIVVAASGVSVAKHGNYGASSKIGSSTILESLGVPFATSEEVALQHLSRAGLCFLHAPHFHPALKSVGPIRRNLGMRTFFNLLGPLCHPANVKKQVCGVSSLSVFRLFKYLFEREHTHAKVVYALDGYDEVSLTGTCRIGDSRGVRDYSPHDFGLPPVAPSDLVSEDSLEDASKTFRDVLGGRDRTPHKAVVAANAAVALCLDKPSLSLQDATEIALETLLSGKAARTFNKLCEMKR